MNTYVAGKTWPSRPSSTAEWRVWHIYDERVLKESEADGSSLSGAHCVFEELRPRKQRKSAADRATVTALEAKVSDLALQLEQSKRCRQPERRPVALSSSESDAITIDQTHVPVLLNGSNEQTTNHHPLPLPSRQEPQLSMTCGLDGQGKHPISRMLQDGALSYNDATFYLSKYRRMCDYSPFVMISEDSTVDSMAQQRPFLLHAVLAISTQENKDLQRRFESGFRESLLRSVTIEGEKSIDLLQAFVVYLAWYHFFYIPMKQQFNQLLQIAISMCIDMGLDHPPSEAAARKIGLQLEHHYTVGGLKCDRFFSKAARRVYLGCHYLSATSSWIWRKPNNLHCTEYLMECAESLAKDPEYETDVLILPLIQSQTLGDQYHEVFLSSNFDYSRPSCSARTKEKLNTFRTTMDTLLSTNSALDSMTLSLATQFATSHAHEMDHLNPCLSNKHFVPGDLKDWASNISSQHDVLMVCLDAATAFIETFLSLPLTEYPKLSVLQWWGLICNTAFLYRLSLGTPKLRQWNVTIARDAARLELYLELLCYRMQCITGSTSEIATGRDLFSLMCPIFGNVKNTYERLKKLPQSSSAIDEQPVHAKAFTAEGTSVIGGVVDSGTAAQSGGHVSSHHHHHHHHQQANADMMIKPSQCPAFRYWSQAPDLADSDDVDGSELRTPEPVDLNLFLDLDALGNDASWLDDMSHVNWEFNHAPSNMH
ncbi:uncharacterized protein A1O9_02384 [Exophiala aquamarina CBS 119918]|uniref:Transcription factor domain-containing protein n=1 Tax=Exophiala aquamarina CBS 119918 TaxID=1182545 RepID=A0A072PM78_9EURO|nr:uncharacterized protein A1O9_02384 [Exophiala aquamarina CBS 119918]KEF60822.1 hypothetical protein A1O9_02384 [Exophiala aquamarina CBS 119918]